MLATWDDGTQLEYLIEEGELLLDDGLTEEESNVWAEQMTERLIKAIEVVLEDAI